MTGPEALGGGCDPAAAKNRNPEQDLKLRRKRGLADARRGREVAPERRRWVRHLVRNYFRCFSISLNAEVSDDRKAS